LAIGDGDGDCDCDWEHLRCMLHRLGDQGLALGSLGAAELGSKAPMYRAYWHVPRCRRVRFEAAADIRHGLFIYFQHRLYLVH
jgi:hypothetical protein